MRAQSTTGPPVAAADLQTPDSPPRRRTDWRGALVRPGAAWALAVALGYLAQVLIRLPFLAERRGPLIVADEIGYLVNARVLSGGPSAYLPFVATYRSAGYAALVAPMYWISDDPQTIYRMALVENVLLSALCFPLLLLLLRCAAAVPRYVAYVAAFAGSMYPTLMLSTQFVWTENLLPPLMVAYLLGTAQLLRSNARHPVGWGVAVAALAAWLYATHDRMFPTVVVTLIVVALAWHRRRLRLLDAGVILVVLAALVGAGVAVNQWLAHLSYGSLGADAGRASGKLTSLRGAEQTVQATLGQWWVMLASSVGLAAIGLVAALDRSWQAIKRIATGRRAPVADLTGLVLVIWTVAISALAAATFPVPLPGLIYYVYGRYLEPAAALFIAVGAVIVMTRRVRAVYVLSAIAIVCGAALTILQAAGSRVFTDPVVNANALGLTFLAQGTRLELSTVTAITVLGVVGFATLGRLRATAVVAVAATCCVYLVSATYRSNRYSGNAGKQLVDASATLDRVPAIRTAHRIGIYVGQTAHSHDARVAAATYQFYVTRQRVTPVTSSVPPGVDVVVAPRGWPLAQATRARSVWTDPSSLGWHVWVLPGAGR